MKVGGALDATGETFGGHFTYCVLLWDEKGEAWSRLRRPAAEYYIYDPNKNEKRKL